MKKALITFIVVFWLGMAGLFVQREVVPRLTARTFKGYASVRELAQTAPLHRMGIFDDTPRHRRIGMTETTYQVQPDGSCEIESLTDIDLRLHGNFASGGPARAHIAEKLPRIHLESLVTIGPDNALRSFEVKTELGPNQGMVYGEVIGESLTISAVFAGLRQERVIRIDPDDVVASGFMPLGSLRGLRIGQTWQFKVIDPMGFRIQTAYARVSQKVNEVLRGHVYSLYEVTFPDDDKWLGSFTAYVDESGSVLLQRVKTMGLGLEFIREPLPHEEAGEPTEALFPTTAPAGGEGK